MDFQVLARRGVGGYRQYRIPALAVTKSGRLIAIYDGRPDFDDLPGPIDLVIRHSDDDGLSWSEQKVFRQHQSTSGFGDASIIVDPTYGENGRVIVLYQFTHHAGFFESIPGCDRDDPRVAHIARSISDDNGETWRDDVITEQLKADGVEGIFATSGAGTWIKEGPFKGRLLQTFVLRRDGKILSSIGYSDDHGETWNLGALIPGGNETAIEALADGSIIIHSRSTPFRISGISLDGGLTISSLGPHHELQDPSDNGSLCRLSDGSLICTHNNDQDLRRNTVVRRSLDNGATWSEAAVIERGSSAYSTAIELADGKIGVLFERNAYSEIVFCKLSLDDFSSVQKLLQEETNEFGVEFLIVPRCIIPGRESNLEVLNSPARPQVPEVDMSQFGVAERKEVAHAGGSTSGDPLYTWDEYDLILGPISPGLHINDDIRLSGRLANHGTSELRDVVITSSNNEVVVSSELVLPGEKLVFLDVRRRISRDDIQLGTVRIPFTYKAKIYDAKSGNEIFLEGSTDVDLSIESGLPSK